MRDDSSPESETLFGGLLDTLRAAADAEDGTATGREIKTLSLGRVSVEHAVQIGLDSGVSARSRPERDDGPHPVRVDIDGTDRLVTVDLAEHIERPGALSAVVSGDTLRLADGDETLFSVTLGDGAWRVATTTVNNGVCQVRVVR